MSAQSKKAVDDPKQPLFTIGSHLMSRRLRAVTIAPHVIEQFQQKSKEFSLYSIEYIPYVRFILAELLLEFLGEEFQTELLGLIQDRKSGAFVLDVRLDESDPEDFIRFTIAIGHLLGSCDVDLLSGSFYSRLRVGGQNIAPENATALQPYESLGLHTDGGASKLLTVDWLVFTKLEERNVTGGRTCLLHLDDWGERDHFANDALARTPICFALPAPHDPRRRQFSSYNVEPMERPIFFEWQEHVCMRFSYEFIHPRSISEAAFLRDIRNSLDSSQNIEHLTIPVGTMMFLNNNYWLHGREKFAMQHNLFREIMRMRGSIS